MESDSALGTPMIRRVKPAYLFVRKEGWGGG